MIKKFLAILLTVASFGLIGIVTATPAHAACPSLGQKTFTWTAPDGSQTQVTVAYLNCDLGRKKIDWVVYGGTSNIDIFWGSSTWGQPSVYFRNYSSGGSVAAGYDNPSIDRPTYIEFNEPTCYNTCFVEIDGTMWQFDGDVYTFHYWGIL